MKCKIQTTIYAEQEGGGGGGKKGKEMCVGNFARGAAAANKGEEKEEKLLTK